MPPVAPQPTPEDALVNLNFVAIPGTVVFIAGLLAASLARLPLARTLALFRRTLVQTVPSTLAITFMVGLAYVTRYSGMDTVLGLKSTGTGALFPFFVTLGWLGVALTGTDAGSNALFGNLAEGDRDTTGPQPDPHGRRQFDRRSHGQDDRRAVDRRREHRDESAGSGSRHLQSRVRPQHRAGLPRRAHRSRSTRTYSPP